MCYFLLASILRYYVLKSFVLVFKMTFSGKYHSNIEFIASFYYFIVAYASSGLNNIFYAVFIASFHTIFEREEGIGNEYGLVYRAIFF